jgi:AcrR family transcriptional regulator
MGAPREGEGTAVAETTRTARREATRQRVLDAARVVFAERGVFGASIEDICDEGGFTRGAVYSTFADKEDVLEALVEREHDRLFAHLDASFDAADREIAGAPDLAAAIGGVVDRILRSLPLERQLSLVQTELEIHAIRRPEGAAPFLAANDRFRARIGELIVEAMRRHGREPIVPAADITDTVLAIAERSVRRALLGFDGGDPDALATSVLPHVLLALSRPRAAVRG